jgi:hypothetical protein
MKELSEKKDIPSADEIADRADRGEDISEFFSNTGKMNYPARCIDADFTADMLKELDNVASELNVGRHAVIRTFLRHALDQYYSAKKKYSSGISSEWRRIFQT